MTIDIDLFGPSEMGSEDDELMHYGVKGMRWGFRKRDDIGGVSNSSNAEGVSTASIKIEEYSQFGKSIQKDLADNGVESADLRQKYGPNSDGDRPKGLTPVQKQYLIGAGIGLAGVAAAYYIQKNGLPKNSLDRPSNRGVDLSIPSNLLMNTRQQLERGHVFGEARGLALHWDQGVELSPGHVFQRISTAKETEIRPEGFYAAINASDVDRYKAILPTYWRQWNIGSPESGGYVNKYRAGVAIKAPSGRESMDIFKDLVSNSSDFRAAMGIHETSVSKILQSSNQSEMYFSSMAQRWAIAPDAFGGSQNRIFFDAVKARGFNALIDFNDAGLLSDTPIRTLDGSLFEIVGNESLDISGMVEAAGRVRESLAHALLDLYNHIGHDQWSEFMHNEGLDPEDFLAHYGVKGMRWGHRKPEDESSSGSSSSKSGDDSSSSSGGSKSSSSAAQKDGLSDGQKKAIKYAAGGALVAGALIGTAVLARNGKIPISSLQSSAFNKNSFAAETKRLEKIPGTFAYNQKMAKIPGSLQAETARLAKIPGTHAHREATLASASRHARTLTPENGAEYMRRVTANLDRDAQIRSNALQRRAQLVAQRAQADAQREAREATMAARRRIVQNQSNALARSGDRNPVQSAVDGVSTRVDSARARRALNTAADANERADSKRQQADGPSKVETAQTIMQAFSMGRDALNNVRNSEMWNQPASQLRTAPQPTQRQQVVANQRRAKEAEAQNRSRSGRRG